MLITLITISRQGSLLSLTMGWGSGSGKKEVLDPAGGELVVLGDAPGPFVGKTVLVDLSGWAHIAISAQSEDQGRRVRTACGLEPRT
jgi:hypothetical protein